MNKLASNTLKFAFGAFVSYVIVYQMLVSLFGYHIGIIC